MRFSLLALLFFAACSNSSKIGQPPEFTPQATAAERTAMVSYGLQNTVESVAMLPADGASLWTGARGSLLGERRAMERGDILTVVIEIDDRAEFSNSSDRSRSASQSLSIPQLLGFPQRADPRLPEGASLANAVSVDSSSSAGGDGSVSRNERLTLRVAATIVDVLPNGVLSISGLQEVRVNFELRELLVSGFVRPNDITRQNEITYDKIASAKISYGGRGHITDMQQPRLGHQVLESVLPF